MSEYIKDDDINNNKKYVDIVKIFNKYHLILNNNKWIFK
jgi:hypothetical protein